MTSPTATTRPGHAPEVDDFSSLFDFLPIGAYRSSPDGHPLRVNPALVRLSGYASEAEMLARMSDIATAWYVDPLRRRAVLDTLERDGFVSALVSEVYRHPTRQRFWVSEHAHAVRDTLGRVRYYEGTVEEVTDRLAVDAARRRSDELLREVTAQMPGVMFQLRIDADGSRHYDFISEGIRVLYGVEPAAVLADGMLLKRFRHPDDAERVDAAMGAAPGQPLSIEYRIVLADGCVKWVQLISSPTARAGSAEVRTAVMVDITERVLANAALRERDERWKLALESTGDGVWDWYIQTGGKVLSARCKEIYGLSAEELEAPDALDQRIHPDDIPQVMRAREAHFAGLTPTFVNERRALCKDGSWKWILSRGTVISRDAAGRPLRMIGTHTDISERKQTDALRRDRDRAESANRATTHFLSRVSHELRTPLNAILGFAQLLELDANVPPPQRAWVRQILASGRHLLGLVDDVLDISSVQTGQLTFACVDLDLAAVVDEAWDMLAATAAAAGIHFALELPADLPRVHADARRLRQVVSNLLSNAIKYNRPGGSITAQAVACGDTVELRVRDTGRGIDADQLGRIFTPFERLGAQRGTVQGTGLGLALSRQLMEAMGGSIRVESEAGAGATFTVTLRRGAG